MSDSSSCSWFLKRPLRWKSSVSEEVFPRRVIFLMQGLYDSRQDGKLAGPVQPIQDQLG